MPATLEVENDMLRLVRSDGNIYLLAPGTEITFTRNGQNINGEIDLITIDPPLSFGFTPNNNGPYETLTVANQNELDTLTVIEAAPQPIQPNLQPQQNQPGGYRRRRKTRKTRRAHRRARRSRHRRSRHH